MQAWDSVLVKPDADSPYKGTAGCVQAVKNAADGSLVSVTACMDMDGKVQTFPAAQVQRLG